MTLTDQHRKIEQIEKELRNVKAAEAAIAEELASLGPASEAARADEVKSTSEAMRAGKRPAPSKKVAQLKEQEDGLRRQLEVAEIDRLHLEHERTMLLIKDAEREVESKSAEADKRFEDYREAESLWQQSLTDLSWARGHVTALLEQQRGLRRSLAEKGIVTDEEKRQREADQAEAVRIRATQAERNAAFNLGRLADAGLVPVDNEQFKRAAREGHVKVVGNAVLRGGEE